MAISGHAGNAIERATPGRGVTAPRQTTGRGTPGIERALVAHLFDQVEPAVASNIALACVVAVALANHVTPWLLAPWTACVLLVSGIRLVQAHRFQRTATPDAQRWVRRYLVTLVFSGVLWGASVPLFTASVPPLDQVILLVAVAGLSAGALPGNGAFLGIYATYLGCTLPPVALTYLPVGADAHLLLGVMTVLYGATLVLAGRKFNQTLRSTFELSARLDQANRALAREASHDALTGLWNRERFETALDQELERVNRYGSDCAVIMIDIDHFKRINDTQGHAAGDRTLVDVGRSLLDEMRAPDCLARWGGEEFTVLLPETKLEAACTVAERLRRTVAALRPRDVGGVRISLGVTQCARGDDPAAVFQRVDDALYRAKRSGRDRTGVAQPPPKGKPSDQSEMTRRRRKPSPVPLAGTLWPAQD